MSQSWVGANRSETGIWRLNAQPHDYTVDLVHPLLYRARTRGASFYSHLTHLADILGGFYNSFHPDLGAIR
jgi:hypothetical protein